MARRVFALLPAAPDWTYLSLNKDCGQVDVLLPEWFSVDDASLAVTRKTLDPEARDALRDYRDGAQQRLTLLPTVTFGTQPGIENFLTELKDQDFRDSFIRDIERETTLSRAQGICIDLGGWSRIEPGALAPFLDDLRQTLHRSGKTTCLIASAAQKYWKSPEILDSLDHLVLKLFDDPWIGSPPAPLASESWFDTEARQALDRIGSEKLVVAIGAFAVDWVSGRPLPEKIGYAEAMSRISGADAQVVLEPGSLNSFSAFVDAEGLRHTIWFLDAVSANNQLQFLKTLGVRNIAISDLGFEDPGVWGVLGQGAASHRDLSEILRHINIKDYVTYQGEGPFLRFGSGAVSGTRRINFSDASNRISGQVYNKIPAPVSIQRYGKAAANQIVLTFDDGPHPEYTRDILDSLAEANVPATFFLVGNNAMRAPDLVRRMIDEGHEIGSHTFMHPRMEQISYYRAAVEINSVQKLINGITGKGMLLYREPFMRSSGPLTASQAEPLRILGSAGYVIAGSDIVPLDWKDTSSDEIVAHVLADVRSGGGSVIVMHDAGSDRSETVAAVPKLIKALREQGYEFVTMAQLLGTGPEQLMPPANGSNVILDNISFSALAMVWEALVAVFWVAIAIGAIRSICVLVLALIRRPPTTRKSGRRPSVTVIIPAFNEGVVILKCIDRVLASNYPELSVVVVDDGSTDDTFAKVLRQYGSNPQVRIVQQANQGKWRALNAAYGIVQTDIAVCIDADTQIDANAVAVLARHFSNPKVGAVAGKLIVGNQRGLLARLQALEYMTAQNIDRRAAEVINGMLVVPGAIGAWRVAAVRKAGLYSGETLCEDADLTISVIRAGYRVSFDERALAYTEAPTRLKPFLAQRLRWSLGMLQAGWKHRPALSEGHAVGLVSLPELAVFGYIFPLIAPIADFFFFYMLFDLTASLWAQDPRIAPGIPSYLFWGYLVLPLIDVLTTCVAIRLDPRAKYRSLLLFPFQRLLYRQLLYFSVIRALLRALTGKLAKWNKADRSGFIARSKVSTR